MLASLLKLCEKEKQNGNYRRIAILNNGKGKLSQRQPYTQPGLFRELVKSQFSPISPNSQAAFLSSLLSFQPLADGPRHAS
jgi:hypothetical protein